VSDTECTLHISIVLANCVRKIIKIGADLTKFWQKQVGSFFGTPCRQGLRDGRQNNLLPYHCEKHINPSCAIRPIRQ